MADYRSMFDRDFLGHWDLQGKDCVVTISEVKGKTLTAQGNKKSKKPIVFFEGKTLGMVFNKTNCKTVASMYGNDTTKWVGKKITLFPTTTQFGNETKECIRVRPGVPS